MDHLPDRDPGGLPLLFLGFGRPQTDRQLVEPVLRQLKRRSVSTLVLTLTDEMVVPLQSSAADVLCVTEPALVPESLHRRCQFLYGYARQFGSAYDLLLVDAAMNNGERDLCSGVEFSRLGSGGLHPVLFHGDRSEAAQTSEGLYSWLERTVIRPPLWSCLLIGGKSSRMGRPKHLIEDSAGVSWAERLVCLFSGQSDGVVLSGAGEIPPSLAHLPRLADIDNAQGPLAGIVAAMRWKPDACWLVSACDMPLMSAAALRWLLATRKPGIWGSVPFQPQTQRLEPLFAHYDYRAGTLFEEMVSSGEYHLSRIGEYARIATPSVPDEHRKSCRNCNFPEDLDRI